MAVFPRRLFEILNLEDPKVIGWNEDGKSFQIHNSIEFSNKILPRYFRHCKLTSFQRQLNLYGFQRIHVGPLDGAYHHPKFQKGNFALLSGMKRTVRKTIGDDEDDDEGTGGTENQNISQIPPASASSNNLLDQMKWPPMSMMPMNPGFSTPSWMIQTNNNNNTPAPHPTPAPQSSDSVLTSLGTSSTQPRGSRNRPKFISTSSTPPLHEPMSPLSPKSPRSYHNGQRVASFDSTDWQHTVELLQHTDSEKSLVNHNVPQVDSDVCLLNENQGGIRYKESRRLSSSSRASMERGGPMKKERIYSHPSLNIRDNSDSIDIANPSINPFSPIPPDLLRQLLSDASKDNLPFDKYVELADHLISTVGERESLSISLAMLAQIIPRSLIPPAQAEHIRQYRVLQQSEPLPPSSSSSSSYATEPTHCSGPVSPPTISTPGIERAANSFGSSSPTSLPTSPSIPV